MTPNRRRRTASGFTLIEVIISMTVLMLVFMSAIAGLSVGFKMLEEARTSTLASQILQSEMENLRLKNWTQIGNLPASAPFTVDIDPAIKNFPTFTCTRAISQVQTDLKKAVISVTWTSTDGRSRARRYVTYIAKEGINDYYYRKF